jgi:hypothetical protein
MNYTENPPHYGDIMTRQEYVECVEEGLFIDYDGSGHPMRDGLMDKLTIVIPSKLSELPDDCTHVIWFNK